MSHVCVFHDCANDEITEGKVQGETTRAAVRGRKQKHNKESKVDNSMMPDSVYGTGLDGVFRNNTIKNNNTVPSSLTGPDLISDQ